tara:strand:+ start:92 stop:418 length:327 start_codon:yes stop_codon:yes gene_type:complete
MNLTNKDYLNILNYYKINTKNLNKKQIKNRAENILATKLCRCIKKIDGYPENEKKGIAICTNSILKKRGIKSYGFKCKGRAKFIKNKKTNKSLVKISQKKTRKRHSFK